MSSTRASAHVNQGRRGPSCLSCFREMFSDSASGRQEVVPISFGYQELAIPRARLSACSEGRLGLCISWFAPCLCHCHSCFQSCAIVVRLHRGTQHSRVLSVGLEAFCRHCGRRNPQAGLRWVEAFNTVCLTLSWPQYKYLERQMSKDLPQHKLRSRKISRPG